MAESDPNVAPLCECGCGEAVNKYLGRWNRFRNGHNTRLVRAGAAHHLWKGGQFADKDGRVYIFSPTHPRATRNRYVPRAVLVAEAILKRPLRPGEVVHHINRVPSDDRPENLHVYASNQEHMAEHGRTRGPHWHPYAKLTEDDVREIRRLRGTVKARVLAERYGVCTSNITKIQQGLGWKHVTASREPHQNQ